MPRCPFCKQVVLKDAKFCPTCDFKLDPNVPDQPGVSAFVQATPARQEPSTLSLMGLVFVGWLGWQAYGAITNPPEVASVKMPETQSNGQDGKPSTDSMASKLQTNTPAAPPPREVQEPSPSLESSPLARESVPDIGKAAASIAPDTRSDVCGTKTLCKEMGSCAEAVFHLKECGLSRLDNDNDDIPCETICGKSISTMQARVTAHPFIPRSSARGLLENASEASALAEPDFACGRKRQCGQMESCAEATFYLTQCGVRSLDRDRDGIPCESICN